MSSSVTRTSRAARRWLEAPLGHVVARQAFRWAIELSSRSGVGQACGSW